MSRYCTVCGVRAYSDYCFRHKPRRAIQQSKPILRQKKPIAQRGKKTLEYEQWRDNVAKPYLDKRYGIRCTDCDCMPPERPEGGYYRHDVAHKNGRGGHAEQKMVLSNVAYKCRACHNLESGIKW